MYLWIMILMISPKQHFLDLVNSGEFSYDENQFQVLEYLDKIFFLIISKSSRLWYKKQKVRGAYIYGGVGRGKTLLMDIFYKCLPEQVVMRMHFYEWMKLVHELLKKNKGKKNPINCAVNELAKKYKVICLDEFLVTDIVDAMILSELLINLSLKNIYFITTSNTEPDKLYENGLQREQFLPAIELIKEYCIVIAINKGIDYRCRFNSEHSFFLHPLIKKNHDILLQHFYTLTGKNTELCQSDFDIRQGRKVGVFASIGKIAWFSFDELCVKPRSPSDYLQLLKAFRILILEGIPDLNEKGESMTRRFIWLVDACYDQRAMLIITSVNNLDSLYNGQRLKKEFQRTYSRLIEMQSPGYFQNAIESIGILLKN